MTPALKQPAPVATAGFATIFDENAPYVLRALRHLGVADRDLQDQSQEAFVAVFRGLEGFGGRSSLRTWIYGICLRVASNYRRRAYIRSERPVAEPPERADPSDPVAERQEWSRLGALLDRLDADKREVFVLYELEELSMKEVAEACDCPLQTAYSRLHAARRRLLEEYQRQEESR